MNLRIALLSGDGIGPEIVEQAVKVLNTIAEKYRHKFEYSEALVGAVAIEKTGNPFPDETYEICRTSDAILFGAIGDPKYDLDPKAKVRPEQGLLAMRKRLGLFANIRPVKSYESLIHMSPLKSDLIKGVDFVVIRELTGGIYFGEPRGRTEDGNTAFDSCVYTRHEVERIVELGFKYASERKGNLTVVDKANVLATSRLWREVAQEISGRNSDVKMELMFVDNAAMQLIQFPKRFDVIVTENMFGDILTDEASVITGSLGLLPSASIGLQTSVFEPIHGSWPDAAGKNIANPLGTVLSAAMLLEYNGFSDEAHAIEDAVAMSLKEGVVTPDIDPESKFGTSDVGDWLAGNIQ
ncbi:MAG: 3-isopropylmalate dehydrogenase [Bacteroidales bacterium]|nr:3-isopropylmalate dehydrogenase [Bacteroidales bacterium]